MERMLRKKKDNSEYEIDRELTGKFAIEKNAEYQDRIAELEEENKKLKEFKIKREESMFYFKAQMERAEPKTASEAEDLQKAKKLFEKLYREELSCLEEENKKLNIKVASLEGEVKGLNSVIDKLKEENQTLELCLDRKEKLNEKYRKELKNYVYDAKQVRDIC